MVQANRKEFDNAEIFAERAKDGSRQQQAQGLRAKFGLCWNCRLFNYKLTKYGKETATCGLIDMEPPVPLNASDPVVECNHWCDRFEMPLHMMWQIATMINVDAPRPAGFVCETDAPKESEHGDSDESFAPASPTLAG